MFWGLPTRVATLPVLDAVASARRKGRAGSRCLRIQDTAIGVPRVRGPIQEPVPRHEGADAHETEEEEEGLQVDGLEGLLRGDGAEGHRQHGAHEGPRRPVQREPVQPAPGDERVGDGVDQDAADHAPTPGIHRPKGEAPCTSSGPLENGRGGEHSP
jgi:hypothetical protein